MEERAVGFGEAAQSAVWVLADEVVNAADDGEFPWAGREVITTVVSS